MLQEYVDEVDTDWGRSALFYACSSNDIQMTDLLLKYHANPNLRDVDGYFPLFIPCQNGFQDVVEVLIEYGADVNLAVEDDESLGIVETALLAAIFEQRLSIIEILLSKGANVNVMIDTSLGPKTALEVAEQIVEDRDIAKLLHKYGAQYEVTCEVVVKMPSKKTRSPWMQLLPSTSER